MMPNMRVIPPVAENYLLEVPKKPKYEKRTPLLNLKRDQGFIDCPYEEHSKSVEQKISTIGYQRARNMSGGDFAGLIAPLSFRWDRRCLAKDTDVDHIHPRM